MKAMQKIIHAGFAICAMASASMPALSWTVWPNIDFEWHVDAGGPPAATASAEVLRVQRESHDAYPIDSSRR